MIVSVVIYVCFSLLVLLSTAPPVIILFSFYLFAAAYGAFALIWHESCDEHGVLFHRNSQHFCCSCCRRPLLLATIVGVTDFLLPAFGFLAGDNLAVAWLGLIGRAGDVVGYLPIVVEHSDSQSGPP